MTEEIFDVVNERDEVVGQASRAQVHSLGLMHRAVHVLIYNSRGEVFLQKRSMSKDKSPGLWDSSASGHVDRGEDYDACAVREVYEELGLILTGPPRQLFKLAACVETDQEHVRVYRAEAQGPFRLHPEEIDCGEWVAPDEVRDRIQRHPQNFSPAFRYLWEHGQFHPRGMPGAGRNDHTPGT